jgi:hypothetical protein
MELLGPPFRPGHGGPCGWQNLIEPELHLGRDVLVPDLGGWRLDRMPRVCAEPFAAVEYELGLLWADTQKQA